jgi:hypothetical protein
MKMFKNLVSLAVFLVGTYEAANVIDGRANVNLDSNALRLDVRFSLPTKAKTANAGGAPSPNFVVVTPVPDVQNIPPLQNP